ncbi:putative domain-containing protein 5 [Erysiphe necator]|uniref:Putative domain-containing protein 5 n=1 Tax=Uncinula necator TaxID=52586 RepID=A0A0B1P742_UNCNE|nr:putative domain-containing protein 5 [Erysiphe necator]
MNQEICILHQKLANICLSKFCCVEYVTEVLWDESNFSDLKLCGRPILQLLLHLIKSICNLREDYEEWQHHRREENKFSLIIKRLDDLITLATEKFYAFPYKDVPKCWRQLFWEASLLKFSALVVKRNNENSKSLLESSYMDEIVKTIDMAHIMAGPVTSDCIMGSITMIFEILQEISHSLLPRATNIGLKQGKYDCQESLIDKFQEVVNFKPQVTKPVPREKMMPFCSFERYLQYPSNFQLGPEPLIITEAVNHWPAFCHHPWNCPSYLLSRTIGGRRLVPIEIGRSYIDEGWSQKIITFKQFVETYITLDNTSGSYEKGYLAQYDLFSQIPLLRYDIAIPDYCFVSVPTLQSTSILAERYSQVPRLEEPLINAWLGPPSTITPLHTDPYHNILVQVVGKKYVRLYSPKESKNLYPLGIDKNGIDMGNTSDVDVGTFAGWDKTKEEQEETRRKFPLFEEAEFFDCILEAGECLFIPIGWWHYVRSLSVSFSVSFWFN